MNPRTIASCNEQDTQAAAREIAAALKPGDVLCLQGNLGAGKSLFARAAIRFLCSDPDLEVPSPTYTLVQTYDSPRGAIWHFDLYRIRSPEDVLELGWEEALSGGIIIVEWPERLGTFKPKRCIDIVINSAGAQDSNERRIEITIP